MLIATDPLSLLFIACFLFGLLFLVAAALLGSLGHGHGMSHEVGHAALQHGPISGHMHVGHVAHVHVDGAHTGHTHVHGHDAQHNPAHAQGSNFSIFTYINPTSVVLFLLGFGFFGYVFHNTAALTLPLAIILAVISGFVIAGLLLALIDRVFGDSEGATVQDVSDRTGLLGKISLPIQENGIGEMIYISPGGMRKSIPVRSVDGSRLERDQEVVVVNCDGNGIAEVDTWEHFISQAEEAGHEPGAAQAPDPDEMATLRALLEKPDRSNSEYVMRKDSQKE
jgi:hypothetical protein